MSIKTHKPPTPQKLLTPFDMSKKPVRPYWFLELLVWAGSYVMTRKFHLKIKKEGGKKILTPSLIFSTHQGFSDYYIAPLSLFPHRVNYVSDMEGFAAFGGFLYRGIGCIGKRRYVPDVAVVRNIQYALKKGRSVVIFPESRHANVGTTAYIPQNLGKLSKLLNVPVYTLSVHGSYLANPFWDEEHTRKTKMEATLRLLYTKEQLKTATKEEVQQAICRNLIYNEYEWQKEQNIKIDGEHRAEGLHLPLYRCIACQTAYRIKSKGTAITCEKCGTTFTLLENGELKREPDGKSYSIPEWYEWEREEACSFFRGEKKTLTFSVREELLYNEQGFTAPKAGTLTIDQESFTIIDPDEGAITFPYKSRESLQTEYNYRKRGPCIVLSTKNCCYYLYCDAPEFNPTHLQFVWEEGYRSIANGAGPVSKRNL